MTVVPIKSMVLLPNHPYCANFSASVIGYRDGSWLVKWRNFETYKCDETFTSEAEATAFRDRLVAPARRPKSIEVSDPEALKDTDQFWKSIYRGGA